jgi:prevent-host-death family protein
MKLELRVVNQQFSKAMKAVRAGKEVVLTERGRPVAVIKPIKEADTQQAALQQMADEGLITLPSRKSPMPSPRWRGEGRRSSPRTTIEPIRTIPTRRSRG